MKGIKQLKMPRRSTRGFTLVEILISLMIGLVVIGAVLATYFSSGRSGRAGTAMAQVTEDASAALQILRSHLAMAGYSAVYEVPAGAGVGMTRVYGDATTEALMGCDGPFQNRAIADASNLTCPAGAAGPDQIAITYQADVRNTVPGGGAVPTDCLGQPLQFVPPAAPRPGHYVADNRFFVSVNNELSCAGNGGGPPVAGDYPSAAQPLVENVVDLRFQYGVDDNVVTPLERTVVAYKTADQVQAAGEWPLVMTVRACVLIRSTDPVLDEPPRYLDCNQAVQTAPDNRLYRAFWTTVALQNRMPLN